MIGTWRLVIGDRAVIFGLFAYWLGFGVRWRAKDFRRLNIGWLKVLWFRQHCV